MTGIKMRLTGRGWGVGNYGVIVFVDETGTIYRCDESPGVVGCVVNKEISDHWDAERVDVEETEEKEAVNSPSHYKRNDIELIDVVEAWDLDKDAYKKEAFCYIARSRFKGTEREDIEKAVWYLNRWLERNEEGD